MVSTLLVLTRSTVGYCHNKSSQIVKPRRPNSRKHCKGLIRVIFLHNTTSIHMLANHVDNFSFKRTKICIHVDVLLFFINIEQGKFGVKKVIFVISCNVSALRVVHHVCVIKTEIFAAFIASLNQNKKH